VAEWTNGSQGEARFRIDRLREIWHLETWGVKASLKQEWGFLSEDEDQAIVRHGILREGMLLEDWEALKTRVAARSGVTVRDDRDHLLLLEMGVSKERVAAQISEQLGFTVREEDIRTEDYSIWNGMWREGQKLCTADFWRWSESK
jgi:hypothetical protein